MRGDDAIAWPLIVGAFTCRVGGDVARYRADERSATAIATRPTLKSVSRP